MTGLTHSSPAARSILVSVFPKLVLKNLEKVEKQMSQRASLVESVWGLSQLTGQIIEVCQCTSCWIVGGLSSGGCDGG